MWAYIARRLLTMPPTLFLISLIIFGVLNLAPGRPGESAQISGAGESKRSSAQRESFKIFKEQFHLDKPIIFNTRMFLTPTDVRKKLVEANGWDDTHDIKQRIRAQNMLEDAGEYLVKPLIALLEDDDPRVVHASVAQLIEASQEKLHPDGDRDFNQSAQRANEERKSWRSATQWKSWWAGNTNHYTWSGLEKTRRMFFDTRFAYYWRNLLHLDFGRSTVDHSDVFDVVLSKLKYSISLSLVSILLAYLIAIPLGIYSAVRQGSVGEHISTLVLFILYSLPTFFTGTVLLRLLSEGDPLAWFPTGGFASQDLNRMTTLASMRDVMWHLMLPVATYTSVTLAALSRYARAGIIDVIRADYVRTARAKGLGEWTVIIKHAGRNGMIPLLTLLGGLLPVLLSGSVVIEVVFNIPGMGLYLYEAINNRDYNAVMAVLVTASFLTLVGVLISDISYAIADPRISLE